MYRQLKGKVFLQKSRKVKSLFAALKDRNLLSIVKACEIYLLGRLASTYCYNKPSVAQIEVTSLCNLHCRWCFRGSEQMRKFGFGAMDIQYFKEIIPQLRGVRALHIFGVGEPLLYENLIEAINYSASFVPYINITTNASLLDKGMSRRLSRTRLSHLTVSIDAADKEIFEYIRRTNFEEVVQNIKYFRSISAIPISINSVICRQNIQSLEKMPLLARELGASEVTFFLLHESENSRRYNLNRDMAEETFIGSINRITENSRKAGIRTNAQTLMQPLWDVDICLLPFDTLFINHLGYITPCCNWTCVNLANVLESGFTDAWNSRQMRNFRKMILREYYPEHCRSWCNRKPCRSKSRSKSQRGMF